MTSELIANLIDKSIMIAAGIGATLIGYRIIGSKPGDDPAKDAWHARFGKLLKILGPLLIAIGIALAIADTMRTG